jgi:hypothetical protein
MTRGTWRHISSLDVDLRVVQVAYSGPTYIKIKVLYLNRNLSNEVLWPAPTTATIQREDLWKWKRV